MHPPPPVALARDSEPAYCSRSLIDSRSLLETPKSDQAGEERGRLPSRSRSLFDQRAEERPAEMAMRLALLSTNGHVLDNEVLVRGAGRNVESFRTPHHWVSYSLTKGVC